MKDCNNQEIQVGDTVKVKYGYKATSTSRLGIVTETKTLNDPGLLYAIVEWDNGDYVAIYDSASVEIIKKANQTSSNIHELQKKAQEDIKGCISKYITEFNNLGFEFDVTIYTHDIRTVSECKPSQLLDVKVTAVLK